MGEHFGVNMRFLSLSCLLLLVITICEVYGTLVGIIAAPKVFKQAKYKIPKLAKLAPKLAPKLGALLLAKKKLSKINLKTTTTTTPAPAPAPVCRQVPSEKCHQVKSTKCSPQHKEVCYDSVHQECHTPAPSAPSCHT